jgi:SWI/SNF-related matrix-associated actin-dependent regulator of chromatin subfamily A protein 2/4
MKIKRNAFNCKTHLEQKERKKQNAQDKEERDRIKALKDNDMDAYINLINTQKNSRLMQILEQTHKYLE